MTKENNIQQIDLEKLSETIDIATEPRFISEYGFSLLVDAARAYLASQATNTDDLSIKATFHCGAKGFDRDINPKYADQYAKVEVQASEAQTDAVLTDAYKSYRNTQNF